MFKLIITSIVILIPSISGAAAQNEHVELAAKINTAENVCDINFGGALIHHVMMAAGQMRVSTETVAILADARQAEIVRYLNKHGKLDEFCRNARSGKL